MRVAAREVGARRAHIRHEHGVADEDGVTKPVRYIGWSVARHEQCLALQLSDLKEAWQKPLRY